jgi:hypothetical protein
MEPKVSFTTRLWSEECAIAEGDAPPPKIIAYEFTGKRFEDGKGHYGIEPPVTP